MAAILAATKPAPAGNRTEKAAPPPLIEPRLLTDLLARAVAEHPTRIAVDFLGKHWAYGEIGRLVRHATRGLQDIGVGPGTHFGLCLPNTPYFVILYFAALSAGATIVTFNPLHTAPELRHQIRDSGSTIMAVPDLKAIHGKILSIAQDSGIEKIIVCPMADILPLAKSIGFRLLKRADHATIPHDGRHIPFDALVAYHAAPDPVRLSPDMVAVLQYTGGTTGVPKGAMLTHANLTANSRQTVIHLGGCPKMQDRVLGVLPLFHVFALTTVLNFSVDTAAEMILLPRFDLHQLLKTFDRTKPTQFLAVPTILAAINSVAAKRRPHLESLRFVVSGGAPLPFDVRRRFERLTGCPVVEGYGLSEASPILTCNPLAGPVKDNSAGPAFPGTIIEIRDLDDPHRLLPRGERGEVCARGPQVMKGYWGKPEESEKAFVDGALRTGDIGYLDEEGYLFLVDRIKDVILCGGYNVYPRTIEEALYEHPAVAEAVAIGIDDSYRGQVPKAFVTLRAGHDVTSGALHDFLESRLSRIEMPRAIEIRTALPKTLIGKLSKKELVAEEKAKSDR
ncbi:long-chain-fatty-acid--CoA ligase [Sphingomonas oleivorans]|nr:long-chain fatty acid--CoA ligase [Sphingomonas oleivorans]